MTSLEKLLDGSGLGKVWKTLFECVQKITGNVNFEADGNLQEQILNHEHENLQNQLNQTQQELDELKNSLVTGTVHMDLLTTTDEQLCTESGESIIAEIGIY